MPPNNALEAFASLTPTSEPLRDSLAVQRKC
jgi:hypothetical protein